MAESGEMSPPNSFVADYITFDPPIPFPLESMAFLAMASTNEHPDSRTPASCH